MELQDSREEILKYSHRAEKMIFIITALYCIVVSCLYAVYINEEADVIYFYLWRTEENRRLMDRVALCESLIFWVGVIFMASKISKGSAAARIIMGLWMGIRGVALVPVLVLLLQAKELRFIPSHLAILSAALFEIICGFIILFSKSMRVATKNPE